MELQPHMEVSLDDLRAKLTEYSSDVVRPIKPFPAHYARTCLYLISAMLKSDDEIEQMCGRALGYPRYADDPVNFPNCAPNDPSVCIGEHVTESIVEELVGRYEKLKAANR